MGAKNSNKKNCFKLNEQTLFGTLYKYYKINITEAFFSTFY